MPRYLPKTSTYTLLATTALITLASTARAEDVTNARTAPLRTTTIKNGTADAINVTTAGSVVLSTGTAITQDSNNAVTNAGAVTVSNASGAIGIDSLAGTSGDIVNSGTITIDEPYTPTDTDNDGDLDGPFALGSNRTGIRTQGAHAGKIAQNGTVTIEGNDSAGVALGGKLTGNFTHEGTTKVLGDRSVGVSVQAIDGNVRLAGTVSAQGRDAIGAHFAGNVAGAMVVQGTVSSTGYRATTAPGDATKLDADDLLQGGPALLVEGNVSGGIVFAVAPKDTDATKPDEDNDGIEDAKEGSAKVVSYGAAPAVQIGATDRALTIGPVASTASRFGLIVDGSIEGLSVYAGVNASGLVIGGRGGSVDIANGIGISGNVSATSNGASATALRIGPGATTPLLQNSGTIVANGGNAATALATAMRVDAGGNLPTIRNSGTIKAVGAGENGSATAIFDASGSTTLVENSGTISATGAKAGTGRNIAIDLSAATGRVTVKQTQVAAGFAAPSIVGDVRLGAGDDLLDLADGTLTGDIRFGGGANTLNLSGDAAQTGAVTFGSGNDAMSLAATSAYGGAVDFGGGADVLSLAGSARFTGSIANSAKLAVKIAGGTLDVNKPASIASLDVGATGVLVVTLDKAAGAGSGYTVAGAANFAEGAKLGIRLADISTAVGSYQVLTAGTLTGRDKLTTMTDLVPFMFKAELNKNAAANTIVVDVARRTATELGLNRSATAAYDAVYAVLGKDQKIENVFLGITNGDQFRNAVGQMLPDHAGGAFEGVSMGARALARQMQDPTGPIASSGRFSSTVNMTFWNTNRQAGDTAAYKLNGYAWSATGEYRTGVGRFGATLAYLRNEHSNGAVSDVKSSGFELAAHWRAKFGPVSAFARGAVGKMDFDGERSFTGKAGADTVTRKMDAKWDGNYVTASGGVSIEGGSQFFFFRPGVTVDYVRLKEDGYSETGGETLNLSVDARTSDELAVNPSLTVGVDFLGMRARDENWFRMETEGGWREVVGGGLGSTTARFEGGQDFTLTGDQADSGWFARLRAIGGSAGFTVGGELSGEDRFSRVDLAVRGSVTVAW
ncbi:autotransporter outer membrane beta-barrel domain-containing protein [Novosphingobium sp. 9U]|uniref:autotransporter outer membrane beta-barrel domain-containing protein n=1 Tax=Novosphingobium sp. 9U TaxID=2653158 RepID=UPI0012F19B53|nr:autotransporter outer membrane beta-barrel domain-containing protein [Novosphingobium sp. 9U]VWX48849.1 Autotransporter domain-containing protein [Novosphingobium sp. 9U]